MQGISFVALGREQSFRFTEQRSRALPIVKERETGPFSKELCRSGRPLMWLVRGSGGTWDESQKRCYKDKDRQPDAILESLAPAVAAAAPHILFQFDKIDFVAGAGEQC
jgi:hypothetical protein